MGFELEPPSLLRHELHPIFRGGFMALYQTLGVHYHLPVTHLRSECDWRSMRPHNWKIVTNTQSFIVASTARFQGR